MPMYTLATLPLSDWLTNVATQVWYADVIKIMESLEQKMLPKDSCLLQECWSSLKKVQVLVSNKTETWQPVGLIS